MRMVLAIGLGGALGAVSRHFMAGWISRLTGHGFPWGIMIVNILGSFLMGLLITYLSHHFDTTPELRAFIAVGVLGGFTTFSTFSLETALLIERGQLAEAAGYVTGSVVLAIGGLFAGLWLGRIIT